MSDPNPIEQISPILPHEKPLVKAFSNVPEKKVKQFKWSEILVKEEVKENKEENDGIMHHLNELMDSPINTEREEMKPFITENPFETP